jgi:hypothetical protein
MARDRSGHWKRLMVGSAAVLAAAVVAPRFVPAPDLDENRVPAGLPEPPSDLASLMAYPRAMDNYVADNFPDRSRLIAALNYLRLRLGVSGSTRVIVGPEGWLFYDNGSHMGAARGAPKVSDPAARQWLTNLAGRTEALREKGIAYLVLCAPDKEAVYPGRGPAWFHLDPDRTAARLANLAAQSQAGQVVYPAPELTAAARAGLKVYSVNETHWTGLGAYQGYTALMLRLQAMKIGGGPRPLENFTYVQHRNDLPRNLALMLGIASYVPIDHPEVDDPDGEAKLTTTYLTDQIDWTKPRVIDTGQPGKPVLMMTMDSFSTALLPYLYGDFSRIILAHNQDGAWREDLIARFKPDAVVLEVVESGLSFVMDTGPPAPAAVLARIDDALAHPRSSSPAAAFALASQGPRPAAVAPTPLLAPPPPSPGPKPAEPQPARALEPVQGHRANVITGGRGDDLLNGTPGDDVILGLGGNDTIHGLGGNDILRGGKGNDVIVGGDGDDEIWGDRGDDTLTGGRGADLFHGAEGADLDLITDFTAAEGDRIVLKTGTRYTVHQVGRDTVIELRGSRIVLKGVTAATLPRGWLVFRPGG